MRGVSYTYNLSNQEDGISQVKKQPEQYRKTLFQEGEKEEVGGRERKGKEWEGENMKREERTDDQRERRKERGNEEKSKG